MYNPFLINECTVEPEFDITDLDNPVTQPVEPDAQEYQFKRLARWHDRVWAE